MTNTLATTAHFNIGLTVHVPNDNDLANIAQLIKMIMALVSFLILAWRELQPILVLMLAVIDTMVFIWKVGVIVVNVVRFL